MYVRMYYLLSAHTVVEYTQYTVHVVHTVHIIHTAHTVHTVHTVNTVQYIPDVWCIQYVYTNTQYLHLLFTVYLHVCVDGRTYSAYSNTHWR